MPSQPSKPTTFADRLHMLGVLLRADRNPAHLWRWFRDRKRSPFAVRLPWLGYAAIAALRRLPLRGARVFEYGSGGSTLFWLDAGAYCVSVEHNPDWHATLQPHLADAGGRCDYRCVRPEPAPDTGAGHCDPADPAAYGSSEPQFAAASFRRYVSQIDEFPDGHFDIILVDGRARPSCIRHACPKVKSGGLLILDNSERPHYLQLAGRCLEPWRRCDFGGVGPLGLAVVNGRTSFFTRN